MGTLTKKEREGLDDVFLSIHSHNNKYKKIKEISSLIMSRNLDFSMNDLLERSKDKLKNSKLSHFFAYLYKKKKNLSK
jgi:hypothetical protein